MISNKIMAKIKKRRKTKKRETEPENPELKELEEIISSDRISEYDFNQQTAIRKRYEELKKC